LFSVLVVQEFELRDLFFLGKYFAA
jgi:hypothetical protein